MRCYNCMKELPTDNAAFCPFCGKNPKQNNAPHRLAAGTLLHNKYIIGSALGEGGFGITYIGFDKSLEIKVAIKEYFPSGIANRTNTVSNEISLNLEKQADVYQRGKEGFIREARSIARFSMESGIVDVREVFAENNTAYIVMEFLDGIPLNEHVHKNGIMDARELFGMLKPIMRSLDKMHKENVIHRDISPDNIMLLSDGTLKLIDFGAARQFSKEEEKSLSVVLKPGYAPYEQYSRKGKQGPWTDVYALCATIYKCTTGVTPPDSLDRAIEDDLKKPSELGVPIPQNLENALMKGLALMPQNRLQSVEELIAAVEGKPVAPASPAIKKPEEKKEDIKTVAADDFEKLDKNSQKTAVADDIKKNEQKTVSADAPVISKKPIGSKPINKTDKSSEKKKRGKKVPLIISAIALVLLAAVIFIINVVNPYMHKQKLKEIRESLPKQTISTGGYHTVGLKSDGTVVVVGSNNDGQCDVGDWKNIVAVSAGGFHTVGLKSDGTVVAVGRNDLGQCDVGDWKDIVAVSAGDFHTVGLKSDGTVVAAGRNKDNQCHVDGWNDIVAVSAGSSHTVGLKSDGTVVAVGSNHNGQCDVGDWKDIVAVSAGILHTVGLKSDGTVVAVGSNESGKCDVGDWKNIVAVSAGNAHTVGLKSDGNVVAVGDNSYGQCNVDRWKNIVAISAGDYHTDGLKSDGTVVAVGYDNKGQRDVGDWKNIKTN